MNEIICVIVWIVASFLQYKLFMLMKKHNRVHIYVFASIPFGGGFVLTSVAAYILYRTKFTKIRRQIFDSIIMNIDSIAPDNLMKYINSYGIINEPESWNMVRGVWFAVNESPQVPTAKKRELRDFLTTKGLRLVGNDKNVIDNYKG